MEAAHAELRGGGSIDGEEPEADDGGRRSGRGGAAGSVPNGGDGGGAGGGAETLVRHEQGCLSHACARKETGDGEERNVEKEAGSLPWGGMAVFL